MSRSAREDGRLTYSQADNLPEHARFLARLPAGEFHVSEIVAKSDVDPDVPFISIEDGAARLRQLLDCGLLKKITTVSVSGYRYCVWSVPEAVHDRAAEYATPASETPVPGCSHSGIRNCGGGWFSCTTDGCDNRVRRTEVRQ